MSVTRFERALSRRKREARESGAARVTAEPLPELHGPDPGYIGALVGLLSIGMIMVYSTHAVGGAHDAWSRLGISLGAGGVGMALGLLLPVRFWRKITPWLLFGCFLALASLVWDGNPLAVTTNGATRWIRIPGLPQIQPSEFAKLAFILFAARFLERYGERMKLPTWGVFLSVLGAFAGLIYLEPDLGTAASLLGTAFCMLLAGGAGWKKLFTGAVLAVAVVLTLAWNLPGMSHQRERLESWWNPWAEEYRWDPGYQVVNSWQAMARGGLTGVGLGQSTYKLNNRLPEAETDFIFAIVVEELGLFRALGVLGLFGLLAWRGYAIAARAPDRFSSLIVVGVTSWVAVQSCLNIAVVTGTVPNTGVPLPFISAGGSSLTALMAATGLVVAVSQRTRLPEKRNDH